MAYMATANLRGLAKIWYDSQESLSHIWEQWKGLLRNAFPTTINYQELLGKMLNRYKRKNVLAYCYEKMALMSKFKFVDEVTIDVLIGGIADLSLRAAAKAGRHQKPEELLQFLKSVDAPSRRQHPKNGSQYGKENGAL